MIVAFYGWIIGIATVLLCFAARDLYLLRADRPIRLAPMRVVPAKLERDKRLAFAGKLRDRQVRRG